MKIGMLDNGMDSLKKGFALYLDYTEGKNLAGITIAPHQIAAFIKRDGHLSKYNYDHLNEQDVLNLLEEAHGKDNQ